MSTNLAGSFGDLIDARITKVFYQAYTANSQTIQTMWWEPAYNLDCLECRTRTAWCPTCLIARQLEGA